MTKMLSRQTDADVKNRDAYLSPSFKVVEPEKKSKKSEVRPTFERILGDCWASHCEIFSFLGLCLN